MARKKSRRQRKRQSLAAKIRNGLKVFLNEDYDQAIEIWEGVSPYVSHDRLTDVLAQAYFRRGLERTYGDSPSPEAGLSDLEHAYALQPDDPCYAFHFGLAAHRLGDLDRAIQAYRVARQDGGEFVHRAAYPLAVALAQQGVDVETEEIAQLPLSDDEYLLLKNAPAFNRRPYSISSDAPPVLQGMAALDVGDEERAREALLAARDAPTFPIARQVAHYYLGVLAARDENWEEASHHWSVARASGLATSHLMGNMGELYHRLAEERLEQGALRDALAAAQEALRHTPPTNKLNELISQAHQQLAHAAALSGDWAVAVEHWQAAEEAEGGSFRLAYNLALAHEHLDNFLMAAERWREALRRRPRRDDHRDAITDEQISRLWRRCSDAYSKAGEYDEAVSVCRHAVKWNPEHIDTRMSLAEVLLSNGQLQAAENELRRILQRDGDYVPALLRMGEVLTAQESWWGWESPITFWKRVLELEPDNLAARQLAADYYQDLAEYKISFHDYDAALDAYEQALTYLPGNGRLLATLGGFYLRMGEEETAHEYFEQALTNAPGDLTVYDQVVHAWIDVDEPECAWEMTQEAESTIENIPYEFYFAQAYYCCASQHEAHAQLWLERAIELAPPDVPIFALIGEMAISTEAWSIAKLYLERAIAQEQMLGHTHLLLGILAIQEGDRNAANRYWKKAERIARQESDEELLERIEMTRLYYSGPAGLGRLLMRMGYRMDALGFDDDEDDDDDFWF